MKNKLNIPSNCGFCKNCFNNKRDGSAYCGNCDKERKEIYIDKQINFPLIDKIKKIFPIKFNTIFAYDDTIYTNNDLDYSLIRHEITHILQQEKLGKDEWWNKYLNNKYFRLKQELEAYGNQYKCYKEVGLKKAEVMLDFIAKDLSSELYGNIISYQEVINLIK